jgi:NADPH:quinone reductase-like Zn-dependent oxidoreductase
LTITPTSSLFRGRASSRFGGTRAELVEIARLIDAGSVRPVLEAELPLDQARAAFERGLAGHVHGKIVLGVAD